MRERIDDFRKGDYIVIIERWTTKTGKKKKQMVFIPICNFEKFIEKLRLKYSDGINK